MENNKKNFESFEELFDIPKGFFEKQIELEKVAQEQFILGQEKLLKDLFNVDTENKIRLSDLFSRA